MERLHSMATKSNTAFYAPQRKAQTTAQMIAEASKNSYLAQLCKLTIKGSQNFPLNLFFAVQCFAGAQWFSDFTGGLLQYPLAIIQYPLGFWDKIWYAFPSRNSQIQTVFRMARYRNIHTDII